MRFDLIKINPITKSVSRFSRLAIKNISALFFFTLLFSLILSPRLLAENKKTNNPAKPKVKASELWGIRRGPNFNKPKDPHDMTSEEALAEARKLQKEAEEKNKQMEANVKSMESGY